MSSPLDVKRRKLNISANKLNKPFVSPLRNGKLTTRPPLQDDRSSRNVIYTPSTLAHSVKFYEDPIPVRNSIPPGGTPGVKTTPIRSPATTNPSTKRRDPAEVPAQRALTSLEFQIRTVKNELDALTQAHQITTSSTDAELEGLTTKWRHASQQVAEELFGTVKERVCRMGGVAAWREGEMRKHDRARGLGEFAQPAEEVEDDDADCEFDSQGEELPEEEQEYRKREKRRVRREAMDAAEPVEDLEDLGGGGEKGKPMVWQEEGKDDDTFTIDMMLRSLNIELETIGYDKHAQRWI
ncbi:hypothetical protein LTR62_003124 [Meristemomyces frigidus]|uniref:Swi5-dependent recombination DNA repair protein 1 n=1 Tax=Meristemomyces frigidus TaxID=1508187 RepID=A0AAN7TKJ1_9PEZI|nr:hypothetical protein LTR62_003124 [Meristemomyces frigidus]